MTPRAGVKTTPATETRLLGALDPKRGPQFFSTFAVLDRATNAFAKPVPVTLAVLRTALLRD
jgi:hypothetical protein